MEDGVEPRHRLPATASGAAPAIDRAVAAPSPSRARKGTVTLRSHAAWRCSGGCRLAGTGASARDLAG